MPDPMPWAARTCNLNGARMEAMDAYIAIRGSFNISEHSDVNDCADGLAQLALDSGSRDNVSCIVIEVVETK